MDVLLLQHQTHSGTRRCTPTSLLLHLKTWVSLNPGLINGGWNVYLLTFAVSLQTSRSGSRARCTTPLTTETSLQWEPSRSSFSGTDSPHASAVTAGFASDLFLFPCSPRASTTRSSSDTWGGQRPATGSQHEGRPKTAQKLKADRIHEQKKSNSLSVVDFVNRDYFWIYCMCVFC